VLSPEGQKDWPIALIYLDLNAFKPINDNYGHEAGDLVLNHVARCLQTSVRSKDVVVRLGEMNLLCCCSEQIDRLPIL
jgi:diguanylate cyclase (GGDEF)-like protein